MTGERQPLQKCGVFEIRGGALLGALLVLPVSEDLGRVSWVVLLAAVREDTSAGRL